MSEHHTPKHIEVIARGVAIEHNRILFCKNIKHGYHYLPGGHVEPGESTTDALTREFIEETNIPVVPGHFLLASELRFTQNGKPRHELSLMFHVEHPHGQWPDSIPSCEDHIEFVWIDIAAIPETNILPHAHAAWLAAGGPGQTLDTHAHAWFSHVEP